MSLIYLASPYTHPDPDTVCRRYIAACAAAAILMEEGHTVFSPIAHSHGIVDFLPEALHFDHDFWMRQDLAMLALCDEVHVLPLPGWGESKGLATETALAKSRGIPVIVRIALMADALARAGMPTWKAA
jgi:hypothetical protein